MSSSAEAFYPLIRLRRWALALAAGWTVVIAASLTWNLYNEYTNVREIALIHAKVAAVPVAPSHVHERELAAVLVYSHGLLWLLGLGGIGLGARAVSRRLSERMKAEESLRVSEERYRSLIQNLPVGLYRNTPGPTGKFLAINPAHAAIFGYTVEEFLKINVSDLYADPAERKAFSDRLIAEGSVTQAELRLKKKDGTPFWCAVTANAIRNEAGEVEYFDGVIEDITARRKNQQRIEAAARLANEISPLSDRTDMLHLVISWATDLLEADFGAIIELDPDTGAFGALYQANFPVSRVPEGTQVKGQGVLGKIARGDVVWTADVTAEPEYVGYPAWHPSVGPCIGIPLRVLEKTLGIMLVGREKGRPAFVEEDRNYAVTLANHAAVGIDRTRRMEMLQAMSLTDELTGLHNRRAFLMLAEQQLKLAARSKKGLVIMFADLDGLKWINDNLGHQVGDEALIAAAQVLRETFRTSDIIARVGGDEFAVLAVETSRTETDVYLTRLQSHIRAYNAAAKRPFTLSLSIGLTHCAPGSRKPLERLLREADALMYERKKAKQTKDTTNR